MTSEHKYKTPSTRCPRISCNAAAMEPTHSALQRLDHKRVDERIRRLGNCLLRLRDVIPTCTNDLGINKDVKLQEMLVSVAMDGRNDPVVMCQGPSTCETLRGEMKQHCKAKEVVRKEAEAEAKEARAQQLEYLSAWNTSLEEAIKRRSTVGVMEAYRELVIGLERFKDDLVGPIEEVPLLPASKG
jgi:hypothetical protein